ncbi:hypothetical protein M422DRAFT_240491 [Sphaerobolus stellatus SS14]|nr:hypothetical protein M422DRAFT_240491 [Sphaerobolus stellatus SS14]
MGSNECIRYCGDNSSVFEWCTPGWLRETLSLRTSASDTAIGMDLKLTDSARAIKVRKHLDRPLGIVCDARECPSDADFERIEIYILERRVCF